MNQCTDQLHSPTCTTSEAPATALRFLDMMLGGFDSAEDIELTVAVPVDWHDLQALVFFNEGGQWVELESRVEREGERLRLTLPAGRLRHIAVALVPQYQSAP